MTLPAARLPRPAEGSDQIGALDGAAHVFMVRAEERPDNSALFVADVRERTSLYSHLVVDVAGVEPAILRRGCMAIQVEDIPKPQVML